MIRFEKVSFQYPNAAKDMHSIHNLDLNIKRGECVVLCGKSGCGKTTVTRLINGLIPHYYEGILTGSVFVNGSDIRSLPLSQISLQVGSVFQNPRSQFFNVDTTAEIAFGCENLGLPKDEILRRIKDASDRFSLERLMNRSIFDLSGGEKQRIACASVYAVHPDIYVLDEPSSNLDPSSIRQLKQILLRLKAEGKTLVISEHRLYYLMDVADRFIHLDQGQIGWERTAGQMAALSPEEVSSFGLRALNLKDVTYLAPKTPLLNTQFDFHIKNLECRLSGRQILKVDALDLPIKQVVAVIGHNGAGKSTLAGCICGIQKHSGQIYQNQTLLSAKKRLQKSYMVLQDVNHQLFTESVRDEVMLNTSPEQQKHAAEVLSQMDLLPLVNRHPLALSGGQKQRVAVAGAVCAEKKILIFDEPTSGLDYGSMVDVCSLITESSEQADLTMVITHDLEFILRCCTWVVQMANGSVHASYPLNKAGIARVCNEFRVESCKEDTMDKSSPKTGMARMMQLAMIKKPLVIASVILSSLAAIASFVPYIAIYLIIHKILSVYPNLAMLNQSELFSYGWLAIGGTAANILLYFGALMCSHLAAFGTLYELKIQFLSHLAKVPLGFHVLIGSGKLRKITDENIENIEKFIAHQLPDIVAAFVSPVVMIVILLGVNWRLGLAALIGIILAFVVQGVAYGKEGARKMMDQYQKSLESMNNASVEYIRGISVVKAFKQTVYSFHRLHETIKEYTAFVIEFTLSWENLMSGFLTLINHIYLFVLPIGILIGMNTSNYEQFAARFIFYLIFIPAAAGILSKILYVNSDFLRIANGIEAMDQVLSQPELKQPAHPQKIDCHDLEFKDVTFAYNKEQDCPAVSHVSFTAKQGQITAIVGPSGGGKSTIAHLIPRFFDVDEGGIFLGSVDIREMESAYLMEQVSFVFQDVFLFKQSIRDNIRLGNQNASDEQIMAAAKAAQCHDFIMALPNGYDTVIGENGVHLSGGERQRIAIARAIVKDAPVVVLDEATAFADPENEHLIQQAFEKLMHGKTVIIIAHRLSTIRSADKIVVMENGCVAEVGSHDTLLHQNGRYASLWKTYMETSSWTMEKEATSHD